jgi:hypothetical protein
MGVEVYLHTFPTSALFGGERSLSRPGRFIPQGKSPQCRLDRRLGGPCGGLGGPCGEEKTISGMKHRFYGRACRRCTDCDIPDTYKVFELLKSVLFLLGKTDNSSCTSVT